MSADGPEAAAPFDALVRERLLKLRREAGLTQRELAQRAGRVQSWIAKLECGNKHLRLIDLMVIATVLDMPVHTLVERLTSNLPRAGVPSRSVQSRRRTRQRRAR